MQHLEDGEIGDSGDSEPELSAKPKANLKFDNPDAFRPRPANPGGDGYRSTTRNYDDSSDGSVSSEEEFNSSPVKSKRGRPHFPAPPHPGNGDSHNLGFNSAASKFQKRNTSAWTEVALEQTLDETIRKVNTVEKDSDDDDDRGVESYNYKSKPVEPVVDASGGRGVINYGDDLFGDEAEMPEETHEEDPEPNICDIEGFGNIGSKKSAKHRLGLKEDDRQKQNRKRTVKDRLGKRGDFKPFAPTRKATFNFDCKPSDTAEEVACGLTKALGEPEYQTELMLRVVQTVGVEKSIELYHNTDNVEENGGMLILNQSRRRSPGGVFFQLVKTDDKTTKEMVKTMFPFHQNPRKKKNKKNRKHREKPKDEDSMDTDLKELPTKAESLSQDGTVAESKMTADIPTESKMADNMDDDDLDLDDKTVDIQLDFPDG